MPIHGIWKWYHLVTAVIVAGILTWLFSGALSQLRTDADRSPLDRPSTIDMALLRIESNVMRIQSTMDEVVRAEYPNAKSDAIKAVESMDFAVRQDFVAMKDKFAVDNAQLAKALQVFDEWKAIRDRAIILSAQGPSPDAQKIVLEQSEAQLWKIRSALDNLSLFTQKRSDDFDEAQIKRRQDSRP